MELKYNELSAIECFQKASSANETAPVPANKVLSVKVVLRDGSEMAAKSVTIERDKSLIDCGDGKPVSINRQLISYLQFKPLPEKLDRPWDEMRLSRLSGDRLIKPNKKGVLDYIDGVASELTAASLKFKVDDETFSVPHEKIHTIQFHQTKMPDFPPPIARVHDSAGNRIPVSYLSSQDGKLAIKTPGGIQLDRPLSEIRSIEFSSGNSKRLTELEAEKTEVHPFFDIGKPLDDFYKPRVGRSFFGPIRLGGKQHQDGLSLRSHTKMIYRLPEKFSFFTATVGIDDDVKEHGDVQLIVSAGDKKLFDERINGRNSPLPINIPINGATRLLIEVNFGDDSDIGDILDIVNPRLVK